MTNLEWRVRTMQSPQSITYERQIEKAIKRAKCKKVLYFYDDMGNREMLGVFKKRKATQIKEYLRSRNLLNRVTEFDVRTTEPDTQLNIP